MKRALISIIFAIGALPFATQAQDKVIRVGVLMPISGPGSYFGVMGKEGIDLALEQVARPTSRATSCRCSTRTRRAARCRPPTR